MGVFVVWICRHSRNSSSSMNAKRAFSEVIREICVVFADTEL
jgi:hypothetical protein